MTKQSNSICKSPQLEIHKPISVTYKIKHLVALPSDYEKGKKSYPLLLFLHGAGECGSNLNLVKKHGPPKMIDAGKEFPFIVVSPQASTLGWRAEILDALLDDLINTYRIDEDRIYLTGLSMGGYGVWDFAVEYPERLAAIAPICGGGDPKKAKRLVGLPIWAFHGALDVDVPLIKSAEMVKAIQDAGGDPKFTIYPDIAHHSWNPAYDNPELYEWFLKHKRVKK